MTTPKQYRKKPVTIEAMRLTGDIHTVTYWMRLNGYPSLVGNTLEPATLRTPNQDDDDMSTPTRGFWVNPDGGDLMIRTLEGDMRAPYGHWIIRGVQGEFYAIEDSIFRETYEAVEGES